jgi:hypothetical protein
VPVDVDLWLLTPHKRTRETRRLRSASERKKLSEYKLSARTFEPVEILGDSFPLAATQEEGSRISGALSLVCTFGGVGTGLEDFCLGVKGWHVPRVVAICRRILRWFT